MLHPSKVQGRLCDRWRGVLLVSAVAAGTKPKTNYTSLPDTTGRYGSFGGRYVPETLIPALDELEVEYKRARADPQFQVGSIPRTPHATPS